MRTCRGNFSVVHNDYHIRIFHGSYALRYDYLCGLGYVFFESRSYKRVCFCIDGACRVVENEYFRLFEKSARYAKALFLSAGNVRSALLYMRVIPSGKERTNSSACESLHASSISSSVASALPQRRFSFIVPEKRRFF